MDLPVVHGVSASPFVRKVRILLAEKGVEYALEPVMPGMVPEGFAALNPLLKVPVYQEGDYVLPDSSAICAYLERKHPEPPLYPGGLHAYGRALWIEEYADTKVVEVLAPAFFERVVQTRIFRMACDESRVAQVIEELMPPVLDVVEGMLAGGSGPALVGEHFSIADIAMLSPFLNLRHAEVEVDAGRWPRLDAWMAAMLERESVREIFEEERASLPPAA